MPAPPPHSASEASLDSLALAEQHLGRIGYDFDHLARLASLGTLAAGLAHEINNILTPALATLQLARRMPDDPDLYEKAITRAENAILTTTSLTRAMLGFSSLSTSVETAPISDALDGAIQLLARDLDRDGILLSKRIPSGLAVQISPLALQQVLLNLLLNARRALGRRGGHIEITATINPIGRVEIRFKDDGPGVPAEVQTRLFQPFATASRTTWPPSLSSDNSHGAGLGLALCRQLVEEAGGRISFQPGRPTGAVFLIELEAVSNMAKRQAI